MIVSHPSLHFNIVLISRNIFDTKSLSGQIGYGDSSGTKFCASNLRQRQGPIARRTAQRRRIALKLPAERIEVMVPRTEVSSIVNQNEDNIVIIVFKIKFLRKPL